MSKLSRIILVKCQAILTVKEAGEVKVEGIRGTNLLSWPPRGRVKVLFFVCILAIKQGGPALLPKVPARGAARKQGGA